MDELASELRKIGAEEFHIHLFTSSPERGWAALRTSLRANPDNPLRYALKILEDPTFRPVVRGQVTNAFAAVECSRCNGDRFLVVGSRLPQQSAWMKEHGIEPNQNHPIEEYGPCPACNA